MKIPEIRGTIERRILVNYRVDPDTLRKILPAPFSPKLVGGKAIAGICLIRLRNIRPSFLPFSWGISSENAAHRIAVQWQDEGTTKEGVYVPRRDTSLWLNHLVGGRIFPGVHHQALFDVKETENDFNLHIESRDRTMRIELAARRADDVPRVSVFASMETASKFFESGSVGYSKSAGKHFDGLQLACDRWEMSALHVDKVYSSFFADSKTFPAGSAEFDSAFLMQNIPHRWIGLPDLC